MNAHVATVTKSQDEAVGGLTTGGGGLAGVDVSDDNDVDVSLFLTA